MERRIASENYVGVNHTGPPFCTRKQKIMITSIDIKQLYVFCFAHLINFLVIGDKLTYVFNTTPEFFISVLFPTFFQ